MSPETAVFLTGVIVGWVLAMLSVYFHFRGRG